MTIITMPTTSTESPIVAAIAAAQNLATVPNKPLASRTAETDESVIEWIREHLAANPGAGKATTLKAFRAAGRSCNQTRFHGLMSRAQRADSPKTVDGSKVRQAPRRTGKAKAAAANEAPVPALDATAVAWVGEGEPAAAPVEAVEAVEEPKAKASKKAAKGSRKAKAAKATETVVELDADQPSQHQTF